ncbi:MAG TPA: ice-binding family protein [Polyangiaceae bacterium]
MKTLKSISVLSMLSSLLLPACGQQLVEFVDQDTGGGIAGIAGTLAKGGIAGTRASGETTNGNGSTGIAGTRVNGGAGGMLAASGSGANGGVAGTHNNGGSSGNVGTGGGNAIGGSNFGGNANGSSVAGGSAKAGTSATGGTSGVAGGSAKAGSNANAGNYGTAGNHAGGTVGTAGNVGVAGRAGAAAGVAGMAGIAGNARIVGQLPVPLGAASPFAILASAAITNIATSAIVGDVGLTPDAGANISGFSAPLTCPEVTGTIYTVDLTGPACAVADPVRLVNAKTDAGIAFTNARAVVRGTPQAISGDLNGLTLYPGLYESGSSLEISPAGMLYLDAQGDGNAIFVIRSATSITTGATSQVVLTNAAKANNVFWTAGSAVTVGTNSIMKGTLIAGTAVSILTGATLEGRALNQGTAAAAITLDSCNITVPTP